MFKKEYSTIVKGFLILCLFVSNGAFATASPNEVFARYLDYVNNSTTFSNDVFDYFTLSWKKDFENLDANKQVVASKYLQFPKHVRIVKQIANEGSLGNCLLFDIVNLDLLKNIEHGHIMRMSVLLQPSAKTFKIATVGYYPFAEDEVTCE